MSSLLEGESVIEGDDENRMQGSRLHALSIVELLRRGAVVEQMREFLAGVVDQKFLLLPLIQPLHDRLFSMGSTAWAAQICEYVDSCINDRLLQIQKEFQKEAALKKTEFMESPSEQILP